MSTDLSNNLNTFAAAVGRKKMVWKRAGVSYKVAGAIAGIVVLVLVIALWPRQAEPIGLLVLVQGTPTIGSDLELQVSVTSDAPRQVVLVAELFNRQRELVNIVRQTEDVDGEAIVMMRVRIPSSLPEGSYVAVVTGRFDRTRLIANEVDVRISAPTAGEEQPPAPEPAPELPVEEPPVIDTTEGPTFDGPTIEDVVPKEETPQPANFTPLPAFTDVSEVVEFAKQDPQAALQRCLLFTPPDSTSCVSRIAADKGDDTLCEVLTDEFERDKCYLSVAGTGKPESCDKVKDDALRSTCAAVSKMTVAPPDDSPLEGDERSEWDSI